MNNKDYLIEELFKNVDRIDEAIPFFKQIASDGSGDAQYIMGYWHSNGLYFKIGHNARRFYKNVNKNPDREMAISYYNNAAENDHLESQAFLGEYYSYTSGYKIEAVKWLFISANKGHAHAQYILGDIYYEGWGVEMNYSESLKWYEKAARQGHRESMCVDGTFSAEDQPKIPWYKKLGL